MHVVATVVPGALLLDPSAAPGADSAGPVDPAAFVVRRRRRPARDAVYGLYGHCDEPALLGVPRGTGYAVVIDARPDAETFGRLAVALLDGRRAMLVPPGCLYGVQAVSDGTLVEVHSPVRPTRRERLAADPDDPDLNIRWLRPRPGRAPDADRSWAGLCARIGAPGGPRRDRVSLW